jgi:hypothetical protein
MYRSKKRVPRSKKHASQKGICVFLVEICLVLAKLKAIIAQKKNLLASN